MSSFDNIYSPETSGMAAGEQALVIARRQFDQQMVAFGQKMKSEQERLNKEKEKIEAAKAVVRQSEAKNWLETSRIRTDRSELENEIATIKRDQQLLEKRELQVKLQEDQRRRNRTISAAFVEDSFANLNPRAVLENLTNSSPRIRKHAMDNISACIAGFKDPPPTFVWFTPQDIAPDLLPKLHQLVSTSRKPLDEVLQFTEEVVSAPPVAKALALSGQCLQLADFLVEANEFASRLAVCSFRRMVGMEASVVKPAYEALSQVIPSIPLPDSELGQPSHPAIDFVKEVSPKIIEDCFNNGLWLAVAPLVSHRITSIRKIVLQKIVFLAQHSDRNQYGLVEARTLSLLDHFYQSSSPPPDTVDFFEKILSLVAEKLCRRPDDIQWLLTRLSDPSPKINTAVINALRMCAVKQDPTVLQMFVKAELLKKLSEPPTQQSSFITKLICDLLPVLAILHAHLKAAEGIVAFLDDGNTSVADAALQACVKIVNSTIDDRTHLYSIVSRLNFAKSSTLKLYDHAMPVFCKDWVESGDYKTIVQYIQHPEQRIRLPAQKVWSDIVCNSPFARPKIVHDGLLDLIFEFCNSQYDDVVIMSAQCCPSMAIEITKAGVNATRQLVELLSHTFPALREAAFRAVQLASEGGDASCKVLLDAGAFKALNNFFTSYPKDLPHNVHKVLTRLVPFISTSSEDCMGLLQLLESGVSSVVEQAARTALTTISNSNLDGRQTLRTVVLNRLTHPTEALVDYSTKAIRDWIGPDLAALNDFTTFFNLISHPDRRIQTAALASLKQNLSNSNHQDSLEKANVIFVIRTLTESDNPEALNFVASALQELALSLARNGHSSTIMDLLMHKEPKVQEGAAAALETIANGSALERKQLLEQDIIGKLIGHDENLERTPLRLLSSVIPKLAIDYLDVGKIETILKLVDHQQQQIRVAATNSMAIIAGGTSEQKAALRDTLLPRLDQASPLLCEVAASCFSRSLAHDLVVDGDFIRLFRILQNKDARVRGPIIVELRDYIQGSDEKARRFLVDAGILPAILPTESNQIKDDLLSFMTTCVLPILGPSFTQSNGGSTLFPLLTNEDSRIRTAGIQALKNAVDSRHGNVGNMVKAGIVETLHPLTATNEAVQDLWCRILPKVAPLLTNRTEVDILFENLKNTREIMREAAFDALTIMAKTSENTRHIIFPSLLHNLENPSPEALPLIAKAVSLSGSAFVSSDKESELLYYILNGAPDVVAAAIEATTQLLAKGNSSELKKIFEANVFPVALKLFEQRSQREHALKLLHAIILHLSYEIINDDNLAIEMLNLFDDFDSRLSHALYQTWSSDSRVYMSPALPELFPLLFDKIQNPSVMSLLRAVVPHVVPQLVLRKRLDIIVETLTQVTDINIIQVFLQDTCARIEASSGDEKNWFIAEPSFVSIIGEHLKGSDATTRRYASTIIDLLSKGSQSRSGRIMNQGIGKDLSWIALPRNGERRAQQSSLDALYSLYMAAPDHADRLVSDSLPNLRGILRQEGQVVEVYKKALHLLLEIVKQSPHSVIIKSKIVVDLVGWLSPRHSITDGECKNSVFEICQLIAQKSDDGRHALVDANVLPELLYLANSQTAIEVISACKILKALAHTGTFRDAIISAGLKKAMENITSPFKKSTLHIKEEKRVAKVSAKEVLEILRLSKGRDSITETTTAPKKPHRSPSPESIVSARRPVYEDELSDEIPVAGPRLSPMSQRRVSEFNTSPVSSDSAFEGQQHLQLRRRVSNFDTSFSNPAFEDLPEPEPNSIRQIRHTRSLSEPDQRAYSRPEAVHLSAVYEDEDANVDEGNLGSLNTRAHRNIARRRTTNDDNPRDFTFATAAEENINLRSRTLNVARTTPPSYKSVSGSMRRS